MFFQLGALKQKDKHLGTAFGDMITAWLPSVQVRTDTLINATMYYVFLPPQKKKRWGLIRNRKQHYNKTQDNELTLQMPQGMKSLKPDLSAYAVLHLCQGKYLHPSQNRHLPAPAGS